MTAVEGYTLRQQPLAALRGPGPLLRLASDERLIALTRAGQQSAFEALVARYQQRLLAFCRHMLRSREDAEDVLQEVFAAAFNAIMADSREINVRPWLYRIARNRSLNHLRRATAIGVDSMDTHFADAGQSTSEKAHGREEFRLLVDDIGHLPESQRSALVLREMDALSYEQIAEAMDTTVSSVKSLLVRARIGLAETAEARKLSCEEVRFELGESAEGLRKLSPPVRRHVKQCDRCRSFRTQLRSNNRALAAIMPLGPLLLFKKAFLAKLGLAKLWAGGASGGAATAGGATGGGGAAAAGTAVAASGGSVGGGITAGAVAAKVVLVVATAAVVGVGSEKIIDHHHMAPPPSHYTQTLTAVAPTSAAFAVPLHRHQLAAFTMAAPAGRHLRLLSPVHVASPPVPYLRGLPAAGAVATATTAAGAVATATTPVAQTPVSPPALTSAPTPTAAPPATPTTQEISTTTAFSPTPSGGGAPGAGVTGTSSSGGTTTTIIGATGSTTGETITTTTSLTGSTGTTSATGSTSTTGGTTGATGSLTNATDEAGSGPATGATGS
jgi:RNA polymerase sigma factor (sigma-70 family)